MQQEAQRSTALTHEDVDRPVRGPEVELLVDGRVTATGDHRALLADPAYRAVVVRGEEAA